MSVLFLQSNIFAMTFMHVFAFFFHLINLIAKLHLKIAFLFPRKYVNSFLKAHSIVNPGYIENKLPNMQHKAEFQGTYFERILKKLLCM